jgi:hypothetical protein
VEGLFIASVMKKILKHNERKGNKKERNREEERKLIPGTARE